jgi:hypothetical protein
MKPAKEKNAEFDDARGVALSLSGYEWQFDHLASSHAKRWLLRKNGALVGWAEHSRYGWFMWEGYHLSTGTSFSVYGEGAARTRVEGLALDCKVSRWQG